MSGTRLPQPSVDAPKRSAAIPHITHLESAEPMNRPVINEAPASHNKPTAAPPSRSLSLVSSGPLARPRTITLLVAIVLGLVATLVGPMGKLPSAQAYDDNPLFRIGTDGRWAYVNFINNIRLGIADGGSTQVPGAGGAQTIHTPTNPAQPYYQVDIQMWGSNDFVRLQLNRGDLYLLGWWDHNNVYHYMGNRTVTRESREAARTQDQVTRLPASVARTPFGEGYGALENAAGETRSRMNVSRATISSAAWYLYDSNNTRNMARGALRMAQFISEAARFRPMRDFIAPIMGRDANLRIPPQLVAQQNNWGTLSAHFNALLRRPQGARDDRPMNGYRITEAGAIALVVLVTANQFAQYVLATSKGR
ncbi:ribosome-inactivating family protein [Streptomyces sp. NPDC020898]|uniref:ribosome-inactivating family protein n=1 Tax=Streptomyces sp. NPDC020898 TaxID=3365101 RepID=UPI0037B957EE